MGRAGALAQVFRHLHNMCWPDVIGSLPSVPSLLLAPVGLNVVATTCPGISTLTDRVVVQNTRTLNLLEHARGITVTVIPPQIAPTTTRVNEQTPQEINERVRRETDERIALYAAASPEAIDERLQQLDHEWDMERTLEANAATLAFTGTVLGLTTSRKFLLLPALVTGFLLQHAIQGWCPPVTFFRRRGVRAAREINHERTALKILRGDFDDLPKEDVAALLGVVRR